MKSEIKTSAMVTFALVEYLEANGVSDQQIEAETKIKVPDKDSTDILISVKQLIRLWEMAIETTGDKALPLHLRERYGRNLTHFIHCIAMNSKNGLEALTHWSSYSKLVCEVNRITLKQYEDQVTLTFTVIDPELQNPWLPEHTFIQLMDYARFLIGNDFSPIEIGFQHTCLSDKRKYEDFFQCPVFFEQDANTFTCSQAALLKEFKSSNPHLQSVLIKKAESDLERISGQHSLRKKVVECIIDELPKGNVNLDGICRLVGMSRSTLHRKLKEENTTFNSVLNEVRRDLVKSYLKQGMNTSQMAYLLGYSNASNFLNAFKKWFRMNPKNFRKTLRGF